MKKQLLFLLVAMVTINSYSQISFEKGYFITNAGQKTECFIKNDDWKNNPIDFKYKLSEEGEIEIAEISSVKEFGVYNASKFIRETVRIDRSSNEVSNLSDEKSPIFNEEQLFLKVLIEGNANLYSYEDGNLKRYFYNKESFPIVQLIYKRYKTSVSRIGINSQFKQQLLSDLVCSTITKNSVDGVAYKKRSLVKFFMDYNNCVNSDIVNYEPIQKEDLFNLTLRPRAVFASLEIQNSVSNSRNTNFGNELGFGFGLEAEFILPFNKNKWAIIVEPTYQNFKSEETIEVDFAVNDQLNVVANYKSIELPMGLRHYFFLDDNSKIFINAAYVLDFNSSSSIDFNRTDGSTFDSLEIETRNNVAFGFGYKYGNRYSLEFRYMTSRDVLNGYPSWSSDYQAFSVIAGFTLF